jgi:hypothetical protein
VLYKIVTSLASKPIDFIHCNASLSCFQNLRVSHSLLIDSSILLYFSGSG